MKTTTTLLFTLCSLLSFGQFSTSVLNFNNVSATVTDGGILFNNAGTSTAGYEVPVGSGMNVLYATSLWFGGTDVNGQLHLSGSSFLGAADIFPGPYSDSNQYTSTVYLANYGTSIWSVNQAEIDAHIQNWSQSGYVVPASIASWPGNGETSIGVADQLAPYVDMNGNGVYEPAMGDYPNIRGDRATYIIMNDAAQVHTGSGGDILGMEVHLMLYQYATLDYLNDLTFINARVFNRGTNTYTDFTTSIYADGDIGNPTDDYTGSDSTRNMIFTYNGDAFDEDNAGNLGYGANPPAVGIVSLGNAISNATYYTNGGTPAVSDPNSAAQYWSYMNGLWADGQPFVFGGTGYPGSAGSTTTPTNFMLSGDPLGLTTPTTLWNWTELDTDGSSSMNAPGDRRMVMSLPSQTFSPGDQICYDYVVVYGSGTPGTFPSGISTLQDRADSVQLFFDTQNFGCDQVTLSLTETEALPTFSLYPNPSNGTFTLDFSEELEDITIRLIDMSGRTVREQHYMQGGAVDFVTNATPGVYVVRVTSGRGGVTRRVVIE